MANPWQTAFRGAAAQESVATFEWHDLHLHVVTREALPADQLRTIARMLPRVRSVGAFADLLGMVIGRHVQIRTERPSLDVRLEVGS
jgi:hypothetical protein